MILFSSLLTQKMAVFTNQSKTLEISPRVMLCERCKNTIRAIRSTKPGAHSGRVPCLFGFAPGGDTWTGAHHIEDYSFLNAVQKRCYICYMLDQALPKQSRAYARLFRTFYEIRPQGHDRFYLQFVIELHQQDPSIRPTTQVIDHHGTFKIVPRDEVRSFDLPYKLKLDLTLRTDTKKCRAQVQSWLERCNSCHGTCFEDRRTNTKHKIRLLNVAVNPGSQVQLHVFAQGTEHPRYVTMSHCWNHGKKIEQTKFTSQTEKQLLQGVSIKDLPQKFQDAIKIARWLKVDFLWIDAMCILQDSTRDWEEQSAIMGDIYAGSYCNIAATKAGEDEGCFRERPTEIVEPYLIGNPSLEKEETHMIGYDDFWCNSLQGTDLHNRAWVLQERLLSSRTIHFGQEQMFWECRNLQACEAYPSGIPEVFSNARTVAWRQDQYQADPQKPAPTNGLIEWLFSTLGFGGRGHKPSTLDLRQAYTSWSETVERYMECNLSRSSDKLVAIAGIADRVQGFTKERYLAGLWDTAELPQSLLWYVPVRKQADESVSQRAPPQGNHGYRAPSWSWASIDAKIVWNWPSDCENVLIQLKGSDVKVDGDRIGNIKSATMRLRGHLQPARLRILNVSEDGTPKEDGSYLLVTDTDNESNSGEVLDAESSAEPIVFLDTPLYPQASIDVHLLPICTQWQDRTGYSVAEMAGLILQEFSAGGNNWYQRIGVFGLDDLQNLRGSLGNMAKEAGNPRNLKQITLV